MAIIKLSHMPEEGKTTNYFDCKAIAPDGSRWESVNRRWRRGWTEKERSRFDDRNPPSWPLGLLGFSLGMVFFASPVDMTFGFDSATGWIVMLVICLALGAVFSNIIRW